MTVSSLRPGRAHTCISPPIQTLVSYLTRRLRGSVLRKTPRAEKKKTRKTHREMTKKNTEKKRSENKIRYIKTRVHSWSMRHLRVYAIDTLHAKMS